MILKLSEANLKYGNVAEVWRKKIFVVTVDACCLTTG